MTQETHAIDHAIAEAQRGVLARQSDDGAWRTCDRAGPPTTGWALVALGYLGVLGRHRRVDPTGAITFVLSTQLPSGAFPDYPGDVVGSLTSTCACYAGLYAAGVDVRRAEMDRAWQVIRTAGGFANADPITQTFLAAAGLFDPSMLPDLPLGVMLLPFVRQAMSRTVSTAFQLIMLALPGLVRGLRARRHFPAPKDDLVGWAERRKLIDRLKELQDPTGHWLGTLFHTSLCATTLHALGLPISDASIGCALGCIGSWRFGIAPPGEAHVPAPADGEGPWRFAPYTSETWNTALCLSALVRSGVPQDDPRIRRAVAFTLSAQGRIDEPREWQNPAPGAPRRGGFPFEAQNTFNLDCDSTGQVLRALQVVERAPSVEPVMREALAWLDGMQNPDGGWPSFTRGQAHKEPGPYPLGIFPLPESTLALLSLVWAAPLFLGDPATEDLTGRVLQALGGLGRRIGDPSVRRAVEFLRGQIDDNGVWWGRWECNYVPSSAYVLLGLMAVGERHDDPYVIRAVRWISAHQNEDGGFGETTDSYGNLGLAGVGESNAYTTGLVVSALIAAKGEARVVDRAAAYLLRTQRPDGLWPAGSYELVVNAPIPFYRIPADVWTAPLQALADYRMTGGGVNGVQPQVPSAGSPQPVEQAIEAAQGREDQRLVGLADRRARRPRSDGVEDGVRRATGDLVGPLRRSEVHEGAEPVGREEQVGDLGRGSRARAPGARRRHEERLGVPVAARLAAGKRDVGIEKPAHDVLVGDVLAEGVERGVDLGQRLPANLLRGAVLRGLAEQDSRRVPVRDDDGEGLARGAVAHPTPVEAGP